MTRRILRGWRMGVLLAWLCPGLLTAQGPPPEDGHKDDLLDLYDSDGDGRLSGEEVDAALPPDDKESQPGAPESGQGKPPRFPREQRTILHDEDLQDLLDRFDVNGNGKLESDEMQALREFQKSESKDHGGHALKNDLGNAYEWPWN